MKRSNYIIRFHDFFRNRISLLKSQVIKLQRILPPEQYVQHELTKLLARLFFAIEETIPENPNCSHYFLRGTLSKFRRFKKGLQRYRLIFCFSNHPQIILYLYINDKDHLRKEGGKNDPYREFENLLNSGVFSHDPSDQKMQKWITHEPL